jgi:hypothetical protein
MESRAGSSFGKAEIGVVAYCTEFRLYTDKTHRDIRTHSHQHYLCKLL